MTRLTNRNLSVSRFLVTVTATVVLLVLPQHVATSSTETPSNIPKDQNRRLLASSNGFDAFDTNHDGSIDRSEYNSAVAHFQQSLTNGFGADTPITSDSNPLAGLLNLSFLTRLTGGSSVSSKGEELKFWPAFVNSLSMIIATEIGDKTFFIAAVLSMKNDRLSVFGGAILALAVMTILSSMMGLVLPSFLPRKYTHIIGGLLFFYFGVKLLMESRNMSEGKCSDELEEVEEELLQQSSKKEDFEVEDSLEVGLAQKKSNTPSKSKSGGEGKKSGVFMQALTMTFLAEWGDRSQIATIALAAAKDPFGVNVGGILGHSLCTGMAVIGGRMLAAKIEEKTVTKWSGIIFLLFGAHSLFFEQA